MKALKKLQNKIDSLNLRERGIVMLGALLVMYFMVDLFALQPLQVSQKRVQNSIAQKNAEVVALNTQLQQIITAGRDEKAAQDQLEIQRLRTELSDLDQALNQATASLVTPQQMAKLLQNVLAQTNGLRLIKVTSLGSSPLLPGMRAGQSGGRPGRGAATAPAEVEPETNTAYKHGLQIEFEGNFFNTLDYMKKLEDLEWKFYWEGIDFKVRDYPDATGTLSLYTISMDKNWIGV